MSRATVAKRTCTQRSCPADLSSAHTLSLLQKWMAVDSLWKIDANSWRSFPVSQTFPYFIDALPSTRRADYSRDRVSFPDWIY